LNSKFVLGQNFATWLEKGGEGVVGENGIKSSYFDLKKKLYSLDLYHSF